MADENANTEPPQSEPATTNLAPGQAAEMMSATVLNLRQQWLQAAVTVADLLRSGKTVNRGTFEDLRRLRENYEELERARMVLLKLNAGDGTEAGASKSN